ncbi:uncharacterized protein PV06_11677 [Exophiala oligosperma]|uniref:Major facilitator superfamily (MFS) profile domain-containing protein n=1 Tax=Exophiala oligosperma TaxID=215243 RepID=A0A0D2BEX5_9EURO|nr:uncharacterized protein PV06_11677 [Exophiala oligosperma]KIW36022.1 hypothetical protein PV06_11677 [Exophiala oligosperma]
MSSEKASVGGTSTHVVDDNRLQPIETTDDVAPEIIGGQMANLPPGYYTSANFIGTVAAYSLANMSNYAGYVMTFNLLSIINQDLGPDPNYVWIATGYTLAGTTGAMLWGRLSDVFGRRWFFIGGNCSALLGSILGAAAPNIVTLIFAQVFIGLALPSQLSFSIGLAELIPNKWPIATIALAIYSTVQNNKLAHFITTTVVPAAEKAGIATDQIPALLDGFTTGSFAGVRGLTPAILETVTIAYQTAFSKAVQIVYLISIAFGVLAIGGALLSPNPDSKFNTDVSRRMHGKENIAAEQREVV